MTNERLTLEEIDQEYPDLWLLLVDCEFDENTELLSGRVVAHSKSSADIEDALTHHNGPKAIYSTRKVSENVGYLL